jgi:anti-sigma regulatory factor (Ser/Thr protein kinase)
MPKLLLPLVFFLLIGHRLEVMTDSISPVPCFAIPARFDGPTLSRLAEDIAAGCPQGWPPKLILDFQRLNFIQPAGVIFLSNLIWWLHQHGTSVQLINAQHNVDALRYLDDSRFFEQHCGAKLWAWSRPRSTTIPLQRIIPSHSHDWLEHTFLPWLSLRLGKTQASFYDLKTCISELFNNIREHTRLEIGSIFVQHYPKQDRINISLADFGLGIPQKVREVRPGIADPDAVTLAVQEGFTTKSIPGNAGLGLDLLLKTVVGTNSGQVTIYSGYAMVLFRRGGSGKIEHFPTLTAGFSPGTTIDINLRTDLIEELPEEREELKW